MEPITLTIEKPGNIKDAFVLEQIPKDVLEKLGDQVGSGYDLINSRRDIEFEHGLVQYNPYRTELTITFN